MIHIINYFFVIFVMYRNDAACLPIRAILVYKRKLKISPYEP